MATSRADLWANLDDRSRESIMQTILSSTSRARTKRTDASPYRVLLIDDDPVSVKLMEVCLRRAGCETQIVTSAAEAASTYARQQFDLVVLDWNMPDLNGSETLELLQSIAENQRMHQYNIALTPVITYSSFNIERESFADMGDFAFIGHVPKATAYFDLRDRLVEVLKVLRSQE